MNSPEIIVKMAVDGWNSEINRTNALLDKLSDEQLEKEITPGRNRGTYLLGHLTGVHDLMLPLLRFESAMYPELKPIFLDAPDKSLADIPSAKQLREQWKKVNEKMSQHIASMSADDWFTRHSNISDEDFPKEPHRNRLNVLMSRTNHLAYHRGQMALLQAKG